MTQGGRAGAAGRVRATRSSRSRRRRRPTPGTPGARRRPRAHHQGRRAADAGDRCGGQRPDVGRGRQHRRRPTAQRRHRGVGARRWIRWRCTATRWPTTASTRSSAGIRRAATWPPRWRRGTAARRWRRPPVSTTTAGYDRRRRRPPSPTTHRDRHRRAPTTTATPTDARARRRSPVELVQAPSNLTGICDRSIQPKIDAALRRHRDIGEVINAVEPRLWNMSTVLPILQDTTIVAAGPERAERQPDGCGAGRHRRRRRQVGQGAAVITSRTECSSRPSR